MSDERKTVTNPDPAGAVPRPGSVVMGYVIPERCPVFRGRCTGDACGDFPCTHLAKPRAIIGHVIEAGDIEALGNKPGLLIQTTMEQLRDFGRNLVFEDVEIRLANRETGGKP